jgi:hypothetical protein
MREERELELLRAAQQWPVLRVGELAAGGERSELDCLEAVFAHHALHFGDRRLRLLHRQRRHAAQARGVARHHRGDAVVHQLCRL